VKRYGEMKRKGRTSDEQEREEEALWRDPIPKVGKYTKKDVIPRENVLIFTEAVIHSHHCREYVHD